MFTCYLFVVLPFLQLLLILFSQVYLLLPFVDVPFCCLHCHYLLLRLFLFTCSHFPFLPFYILHGLPCFFLICCTCVYLLLHFIQLFKISMLSQLILPLIPFHLFKNVRLPFYNCYFFKTCLSYFHVLYICTVVFTFDLLYMFTCMFQLFFIFLNLFFYSTLFYFVLPCEAFTLVLNLLFLTICYIVIVFTVFTLFQFVFTILPFLYDS